MSHIEQQDPWQTIFVLAVFSFSTSNQVFSTSSKFLKSEFFQIYGLASNPSVIYDFNKFVSLQQSTNANYYLHTHTPIVHQLQSDACVRTVCISPRSGHPQHEHMQVTSDCITSLSRTDFINDCRYGTHFELQVRNAYTYRAPSFQQLSE